MTLPAHRCAEIDLHSFIGSRSGVWCLYRCHQGDDRPRGEELPMCACALSCPPEFHANIGFQMHVIEICRWPARPACWGTTRRRRCGLAAVFFFG
jgi:hypothetical protein